MECWMNGQMAILKSDFHDGSKETVLTVHTLMEGLLWGSETGGISLIAPLQKQTMLTSQYLYGWDFVRLGYGNCTGLSTENAVWSVIKYKPKAGSADEFKKNT